MKTLFLLALVLFFFGGCGIDAGCNGRHWRLWVPPPSAHFHRGGCR
jgi:hypothetical protein